MRTPCLLTDTTDDAILLDWRPSPWTIMRGAVVARMRWRGLVDERIAHVSADRWGGRSSRNRHRPERACGLTACGDDPVSAILTGMRPIARAAVTMVLLGSALVTLAGCSSMPIPPTYTQEELKAKCEQRGGGRWHPDDLMGGFCEPIHS